MAVLRRAAVTSTILTLSLDCVTIKESFLRSNMRESSTTMLDVTPVCFFVRRNSVTQLVEGIMVSQVGVGGNG